jgi:signal transduction histidine kinase
MSIGAERIPEEPDPAGGHDPAAIEPVARDAALEAVAGAGPLDAGAGGDSLEARIRGALKLVAIREHSLLSLSELTQNLSSSPDLFHLADLVLFNLMGQFGTSKAGLWLASETEGGAPVLIRAHGVNRQVAKGVGMACVSKLVDLPEPARGLYRAPDLREVCGEAGQTLAQNAGLALFARIPGRDSCQGVVALGGRIGGNEYGTVEFQALRAALSVLGVAIQNLTLYARITENNRKLRAANEDLQALDRLKSEFISNVNHELRTPLSTIIGYVDCLIDPSMKPDNARDILRTVMDEALKLRGLLENLLEFSAATRDRLGLQFETGDVAAFLGPWCEERRPGVSEGLREFVWTIDPDLPAVRHDRKRLLQVIDALVDNAAKFSPEGSRVELKAYRLDREKRTWLVIEVADDGPGIPPERIPKLFDAFRQADGSSTRTVGGMGIGLAFSRELVNAMGGQIYAKSDLGKGSTFTILMPAASPAA